MVTKLKHLKRGFTLVELMIVVAIVGILAALAIYGVSKYVANAKSAEARNALGRMAKDAVAAYQKEAMAGDVLAPGAETGVSHRLCSSAAAAVPAAAPAAKKYQSSPADWATGDKDSGWTCLKFSMDAPQYYSYNYTSEGGGVVETTFVASAQGDLDGDTDLSTFEMKGAIQPDTGNAAQLVAVFAPNIEETNPDE